MNQNEIHVCKKCKTEHFSEDEKNRVPDPEWEGAEVHVCKNCGHDTFYLKFKK